MFWKWLRACRLHASRGSTTIPALSICSGASRSTRTKKISRSTLKKRKQCDEDFKLATEEFKSRKTHAGWADAVEFAKHRQKVAEEFRKMFPGIFNETGLKQAWAYNYDDTKYHGIGTHGDNYAVNCNLWVTPDSANLDK